jgi:hypothetical protein
VARRKLNYNPQQDYYEILGIDSSASQDDIQQSYRQKAKQLHPDMNPDRREWATEQFQLLNEAYDVLGDNTLRRTYDELRWPHRQFKSTPRSNPTTSYTSTWSAEDRWWETPPRRQPSRYEYTPPVPKEPAGVWLEKAHLGFLRPAYVTLIDLFNSPYRYILNLLALIIVAVLLFQTFIVTGIVQLPSDDSSSNNQVSTPSVNNITSGIVPTDIPPTPVPTISSSRITLKSCAPDIVMTVHSIVMVGRVLQIKADYQVANGETISEARNISLNRVTVLNDTLVELIEETEIPANEIDFVPTSNPALVDNFPLLDDLVISVETSYGKNMIDGVYLLHWTPILSSGTPHFACDVLLNVTVQ